MITNLFTKLSTIGSLEPMIDVVLSKYEYDRGEKPNFGRGENAAYWAWLACAPSVECVKLKQRLSIGIVHSTLYTYR